VIDQLALGKGRTIVKTLHERVDIAGAAGRGEQRYGIEGQGLDSHRCSPPYRTSPIGQKEKPQTVWSAARNTETMESATPVGGQHTARVKNTFVLADDVGVNARFGRYPQVHVHDLPLGLQ